MKKLLTTLLFIALFLVLLVGRANAAAEDPAAVEVSEIVVRILGAALLLVFTALAPRLFKALETRTKIDVPYAFEEWLAKKAEQGIHYAEEQVTKAVKNNADKLRGPEKLEKSVDFIFDQARAHKEYLERLETMGKEALAKYIEAQLQKQRKSED